jgi:uncharacterized membrane protein YuzA (DUF378 family)
MIIANVFLAAKTSPTITLFLCTLGFLGFILYGALFVANQGIFIFILYVILAICALMVLVVLLMLNNIQSSRQHKI